MSITNIAPGKKAHYTKAVFVPSNELCHKIACKSESIAPYILTLTRVTVNHGLYALAFLFKVPIG